MKRARKRSASGREIVNMTFRPLGFKGEMLELVGDPELTGCWLIWGEPSNGKTSFCMQLAAYLATFVRVGYNTIEEGFSLSLKNTIMRTKGLLECGSRFQVLDKEPIDDLIERLKKRKSPDVIFIDSLQYTGLNKMTAKALCNRFPNKLFIFVSHALGNNPKGTTADAVYYDANVKIFVKGFQAKAQSRFGGDKAKIYTIWQEGADNFGKAF